MGRPVLADFAAALKASLSGDDKERGEAEAVRIAFSFVEAYERAPADSRAFLVETRPEGVGDGRFDALLGALAEHLCAQDGASAPAWVEEPDRFLDTWWFVAGLRSLEADALVHSPISFSRRGIFITAGALSYA